MKETYSQRWSTAEPTGVIIGVLAAHKSALANVQTSRELVTPKKSLCAGLRALSKLLRAATVHAALIQGVLATLKAAACNSLDG